MPGKMTTDGRQHVADRLQNSLHGTALPETYDYIEIGTGTKGNLTASAALQLNANAAKGATTVVLKDSGGVLTGSLVAGDYLLFGDDDERYEVAAPATASGNLITVNIVNPLESAKLANDPLATFMGGTNTTTGVRAALATGGRVAVTAGWPKIVSVSTGAALEFKASFPAGTFSVGTAITEAAVRQSAAGGKCFGYAVLDVAQSPSSSQSLDVTIQFPILAII